jgi:hypothetical protein
MNEVMDRKTWEEFRENGLLWWVNRVLHIFGWAIIFKYSKDNLLEVYPARVKFRGFTEEIEKEGHKQLTDYLENNIEDLSREL